MLVPMTERQRHLAEKQHRWDERQERDAIEKRKNRDEATKRCKKKYPERVIAISQRYYQENTKSLRVKTRKYAVANPARVSAYKRKWELANPEKVRAGRLWSKYRMRPEQFEAIFEAQGRCCAICKSPDPQGGACWHVDHDHGKPRGEGNRGILCPPCNHMIGFAREKRSTLLAASKYLKKFQCEATL